MWELLGFWVCGAVIAGLVMAAICFFFYQAGVLSARREIAAGSEDYSLGKALASYVFAMVGLVAAMSVVAVILEKLLMP